MRTEWIPLTALIVANLASRSLSADPMPNVILILADDLGYADLRCYGHPYARTPHLDRLAQQGTRFLQFYATGVTCCPARTGLMTGRFPARFQNYPADHGFGTRVTVTDLLKKAGYRTGHFGKWHIGPTTAPGTYGFDAINSHDGPRIGKKRKSDDQGRDHAIFSAAIDFIDKNKDAPFYVNIWGHISHNPVNPSQQLVDRWKNLVVNPADFPADMREKLARVEAAGGDASDAMRRYLADVESLDADVGRLLDRLDQLGLTKNTIVVFSSDQGADMTKAHLGGLRFNQMGYNGDIRGGKHTQWEGGVRVPFLLRWPGKVASKTTNHQAVISGVDWLPTLCGLVGIDIDPGDFDGENVSAAWEGKKFTRTKPLFWKTSNARSEMVIRSGDWKLFAPNRRRGTIQLFDIRHDPREATNLAASQPQLVAKLKSQLDAWNAGLPAEYSKTNDED